MQTPFTAMGYISVKNQPSVSKLRREREREELKERIMDIAREMFLCEGYEAVTLRKIALAIEYTPGYIYKLFKDKQELIEAILHKDTEDLRAHLLHCLTQDNPLERIIEMARHYSEWAITHPNHYRLMLFPPPAWSEKKRHPGQQASIPLEQEALNILTELVKKAMRTGQIKKKYSDPRLIAATLWAGIIGAVLIEISVDPKGRIGVAGKDSAFNDRFDALREAFLYGLLAQRSVKSGTRRLQE